MDAIAWDAVVRVLVAAALGAAIGIEREVQDHAAGFRTHVLVAVGAAAFTIAGLSYGVGDPTRVASEVASGIGFLGAGAILRRGLDVRGLTTAASLWVTAALGVAAGFGSYTTAIAGTVLVLVVLVPLKFLERGVLSRRTARRFTVDVAADVPLAAVTDRLAQVLDGVQVRGVLPGGETGRRLSVDATIRRHTDLAQVGDQILALDGIRALDVTR